jgi:hypothetical protein
MLKTVLARQDEQASDGMAADAVLAVADGLTGHDFDVLEPASDGSRYLQVTNARNALSEITISENGRANWEYRPFCGSAPGPVQVMYMVMDVLGGNGDECRRACPRRPPNLTLKSIVGRVLRECGMQVRVAEMSRDDDFAELHAEIMVANPARPGRGFARVGDDGMIRWECRLGDPAAGSERIGPGELAGTIARALMRAEVQQDFVPPSLTGMQAG